MTKFSSKGTEITSLSAWTRDAKRHLWLEDAATNPEKDNRITESLIHSLIAQNVKSILFSGFLTLADSTNDFVAFASSDSISISGSVYEVESVFYAYCNGNIFKVNTGTATLTETIRLEISATEDGMFQTLDIADGASIVAFEGNEQGDGVVNYSDIIWLKGIFDIDVENNEVQSPEIIADADLSANSAKLDSSVIVVTDGGGFYKTITVSKSYHRMTGTASKPVISTINGGTIGMIVTFTQESSKVRFNSVGNIKINLSTSGIKDIEAETDSLTLIYNGEYWLEISRST